MRRVRPVLSVISLLLAGCGSAPPAPSLFSIDAPDAPSVADCKGIPLVAVPPAQLPEYADHDAFVRRIATHQIALDDTAHWAERPSVAVARLVAATLRTHGRPCAGADSVGDAAFELRLAFDKFEFGADGGAVLTGSWRLIKRDTGGVVAAGSLARQAGSQGAGAAGSAAAMNTALDEAAAEIATAVAPHAN